LTEFKLATNQHAEQPEGVELVVDLIDARSEVTCGKLDGYFTTPLKLEKLEAIT